MHEEPFSESDFLPDSTVSTFDPTSVMTINARMLKQQMKEFENNSEDADPSPDSDVRESSDRKSSVCDSSDRPVPHRSPVVGVHPKVGSGTIKMVNPSMQSMMRELESRCNASQPSSSLSSTGNVADKTALGGEMSKRPSLATLTRSAGAMASIMMAEASRSASDDIISRSDEESDTCWVRCDTLPEDDLDYLGDDSDEDDDAFASTGSVVIHRSGDVRLPRQQQQSAVSKDGVLDGNDVVMVEGGMLHAVSPRLEEFHPEAMEEFPTTFRGEPLVRTG